MSAENNAAGNATARRARRLPRTASPIPLYELTSGLALAVAFGIRKLRKGL
jgi:hypothetical protein